MTEKKLSKKIFFLETNIDFVPRIQRNSQKIADAHLDGRTWLRFALLSNLILFNEIAEEANDDEFDYLGRR